MTPGYRALKQGAAWLDLTGRGILFASGSDSARLLHAMSTNHIQDLEPGAACYAFFLNAQGRIQADALILRLDDRFLLDTEPETRERLYRHLDKYIIADDVTLDDASDRLAVIAVEGPAAPSLALSGEGRIVVPASFTGAPALRIYLPVEQKSALLEQLAAAGVVPASAEDAEAVRLENGHPRYGQDIFDMTLPQETQQMHAVHFQKGCYLGQEIVERIRSRGHVNKLLVRLTLEGSQVPTPGTPLSAEGKEAGEITSATCSPDLGKVVALGYVRAAHAAAGTPLQAGDLAARVV